MTAERFGVNGVEQVEIDPIVNLPRFYELVV
jgi:hypothetical protein